MKLFLLSSLFCSIFVIAACHTKKNATSTTSSSPPVVAPVASSANPSIAKPADGIYSPGSDELTAIHVKYKDVTMVKLQQGYDIYAQGACIKCHTAENIYKYSEDDWIRILENMAWRAKLSDDEKDAVLKYVFAVKAAKPQ